MSNSDVTLIGNLTAEPEIRYLDNGTAKAEFSIAANHNYKDKDGDWQSKPSYFDCIVWRNLAEDTARILEKGMSVIVTGRLEQRTWDDKETGQKRSKIEVVVDDIGLALRGVESVDRRKADPAKHANGQSRPTVKQPAKQAARRAPIDDEPF